MSVNVKFDGFSPEQQRQNRLILLGIVLFFALIIFLVEVLT